jgi:uncharacterized protein
MEARPGAVGSVVSMWRYPVKSMQGEEIHEAAMTERGVLGDRVYALVDRSTGKVASAKHPGKWGLLFACRAAFAEPPQLDTPLPPVTITLPDGASVSSAQADIDRLLSRMIGRDVTLLPSAPATATFEAYVTDNTGSARQDTIADAPLARAALPGTLFNYAAVHLLATATLDRLRELYPAGRFAIRRFRPNLVVAPLVAEQDFVENAWIGHKLAIGQRAWMHIIDPCPRCVVTTLPSGDLPHDPGILRTIARYNAAASATAAPGVVLPAVAGVYASVLRGGTIRRGDPVWLEYTTELEASA